MIISKLKRPAAFIASFLLLLSFFAIQPNAAEDNIILHDSGFYASIPIRHDGELLPTEKSALLIEGTTYVPFLAFCEALLPGGSSSWDIDSETASYECTELTVKAPLGENYILANGNCIQGDAPVRMMDESIYVPADIIAVAFGFDVEWTQVSFAVDFITAGGIIEPKVDEYTEEDVLWLARIIYAESCGESFEGKVAVGNVVLNRVENEMFPDTVHDVIFDTRWGVAQFSTVNSPALYGTPDESCFEAAELCLSGLNVGGDALYFANARIASSCWAARHRPYLTQIGNHVFYS